MPEVRVIPIGSGVITFDSVVMPKTKGGIKFSYSTETQSVETDQDLADVDEILTKQTAELEAPFTEADFQSLLKCFPGAVLVVDGGDPDKMRIDVPHSVGGSLKQYAKELTVAPASGHLIDTLIIHSAAPIPSVEWTYEKGTQRVYTVKFKAFAKEGKPLWSMGDKTATAAGGA